MAEDKRRGLSRALYGEIRARIADGTYAAGAVLPSTRALAAERGLSRGTVLLVYEQLAADGFIDTQPGAASKVAAGATIPLARNRGAKPPPDRHSDEGHKGRLSAVGRRIAALGIGDAGPTAPSEIDFLYGPLAGGDFPTLTWMKALRAVERQRPTRLEYEDPRGNLESRRALQGHLSQTRGLSCTVDQIMIVNGSQQALDLCARLLIDPGDGVVVENPGYRMAHHAFEACGAKLICVDVDEHGLQTDRLDDVPPAQLAYVTPTHQFPLGGLLPIGRRRALLDWAARRRAWIIEDDYDSEYRYSVRPEATLQSLDSRGCVIHVGTFSKTLSPQLRLGYMVLPSALVATFTAAKRVADRHAATSVQGGAGALAGRRQLRPSCQTHAQAPTGAPACAGRRAEQAPGRTGPDPRCGQWAALGGVDRDAARLCRAGPCTSCPQSRRARLSHRPALPSKWATETVSKTGWSGHGVCAAGTRCD